MITQAKKIFNKFTQREKILITALLWVITLLWANWLNSRLSTLSSEISTTHASLKHQQIWLDNQSSIEERLLASRQILDPGKTYPKNQFIAKVETLAKSSGATFNITNPTTRTGDIFNEHTLTIQFKDATLKSLLTFENAIQKEGAYMGLKELKIDPNKRDPNLLNAQFDIIALELKKIENSKLHDKKKL